MSSQMLSTRQKFVGVIVAAITAAGVGAGVSTAATSDRGTSGRAESGGAQMHREMMRDPEMMRGMGMMSSSPMSMG